MHCFLFEPPKALDTCLSGDYSCTSQSLIIIIVTMKEYAALILAAGKGTRMKSGLCKVLHPVAGRPMISYVVDAVVASGIERICLVVGHQADEVKRCVDAPGVQFAFQEPQLGTGHAVMAARDLFADFTGNILILCGDTPLIEVRTIRRFVEFHEANEGRMTVLTSLVENPFGYGRVLRDEDGHVIRIVEERDADDLERAVNLINTGIYIVEASLLYAMLETIKPDNSQGEYYLTDIVSEARKESAVIQALVMKNHQEALGINRRSDLARVSQIIWTKIRETLMNSGVTLMDPSTVYIDAQVRIGPDTLIYPSTVISGATVIGSDCIIESGVTILDSELGDRVSILQGSRLHKAKVSNGATVGPMAHLRPEADIGCNARIGNFVEVKKTLVGEGTKAAHLTYLGDSIVGKNVNIGCGTITCNYDGKHKHTTVIGDNCFVGSDVQFVAPVEIGEGSLVGAGSTITKDVPPRSLAVARVKQKVYPLRSSQGPESRDEDRKS